MYYELRGEDTTRWWCCEGWVQHTGYCSKCMMHGPRAESLFAQDPIFTTGASERIHSHRFTRVHASGE